METPDTDQLRQPETPLDPNALLLGLTPEQATDHRLQTDDGKAFLAELVTATKDETTSPGFAKELLAEFLTQPLVPVGHARQILQHRHADTGETVHGGARHEAPPEIHMAVAGIRAAVRRSLPLH